MEKNTSMKVPMVEGKPFYKSVTVWSAVVGAAIAVASAIWGESNMYVVGAISLASAVGIYGRNKAAPMTAGVLKSPYPKK